MIVVTKEYGITEAKIMQYDYYHPSQLSAADLNGIFLGDNGFKSIDWNIHFVKKHIPLYILDHLKIKYSTGLKTGDNNYVLHRNFPYTINGNESRYYMGDFIDPTRLCTSHIMRFEYFIRFINFMLPIPNQEEMDFIQDSLKQFDDFPLSIACTYNLYYFLYKLNTRTKYINMHSPEGEWVGSVVYDYITFKNSINLYIERNISKIIKHLNNDKSK